jgi:hypothetical protein
MDVQNLQDAADVRIKFASLNEKGEYVRDAGDEYQSYFEDLENGWTAIAVDAVLVEEVGRNRAWVISDGNTQLAAVAHETGIEFLLNLGAGLTLEALILFARWGWKKWNQSRSSKIPSSLQMERVTERLADGRIRVVEKIEIRGPLDARIVGDHMERFIGARASS